MFETLKQNGIDPFEYISVSSLRTYDRIGAGHSHAICCDSLNSKCSQLVTEQIYVHSKLMIIDDRVAIIGSANVNDRSFNGSRDSEIAILIKDCEFEQSFMNGVPYDAGRSCLKLRKTLFAEHLGIREDDIHLDDPISNYFFHNVWNKTAETNTTIYRSVFKSMPDDSVLNWADYQKVKNSSSDVSDLKKICGHLVQYPLNFLAGESLNSVFPAKEFIIPMDVFI